MSKKKNLLEKKKERLALVSSILQSSISNEANSRMKTFSVS